MIRVTQHLPGYVDTKDGPEHHAVLNTRELLALPFIARWREGPEFHRFSISRERDLLLCELNGGRRWWVMAYLTADNPTELLDLPVWRAPETPPLGDD
jgi:hypothetical protein